MDILAIAAQGRANFHTHSTWCDGAAAPRDMAKAALSRGFCALGFSSHAMLPADPLDWPLTREKFPRYVADIRALASEFAGRLPIYCGVEADYIPDLCFPDRAYYGGGELDYMIGSIHFVRAPDGALVEVDKSPQSLAEGIASHFAGDAKAYIKAYFAQLREMVQRFDFDILGHADLIRKFNPRLGYFDEAASWYREEMEKTAEAIAASGKIVEINTGAISRGWMDDAYPSREFFTLLADRGARFLLSSDAHAPEAIDCAFDRFAYYTEERH